MGNLLTYSGLTTKVRAMESRFFTERQYEELASLATVGEALEFIKSQPAYGEVLASADSGFLSLRDERGAQFVNRFFRHYLLPPHCLLSGAPPVLP